MHQNLESRRKLLVRLTGLPSQTVRAPSFAMATGPDQSLTVERVDRLYDYFFD
jgi:hypothetical protein